MFVGSIECQYLLDGIGSENQAQGTRDSLAVTWASQASGNI